MKWNWQQPDWPDFAWDKARFAKAEERYLLEAGECLGALKHLGAEQRDQLTAETMSEEAVTTSEIEGESLDRDSVQSSIRRQLGLADDQRRVAAAEQGIAEMMVDLCRSYAGPLSDDTLFKWHRMLTSGQTDVKDIGRYRTDTEPIQVVSGPLHAR